MSANRLLLVLSLVVATQCGSCNSDNTNKSRIIEGTRVALIHDINDYNAGNKRHWARQENEFSEAVLEEQDAYDAYVEEQYREAVNFLDKLPALEGPYMMACLIDVGNGFKLKPEIHPSPLILHWLEYDTHAYGIILAERGGEPKSWRLPVFAGEQNIWTETEGTAWRMTASRTRCVRVSAENVGEPFIREAPPEYDFQLPVVLVIPRKMAKKGLLVGIYDEKGNESKLVPAFIPFCNPCNLGTRVIWGRNTNLWSTMYPQAFLTGHLAT
jgi:hypothetical protein